jgi:hypothetical protein
VNPNLCQFLFTNACLYIGSTRSLKAYSIKPKTKKAESKGASDMWSAIQIPVYSTLALLTIYFSLINELTYISNGMMAYFMVISGNVIYEHMYELCINSFAWIQFHDETPMILGLSRLKLFLYVLSAYFVYVYFMTGHWLVNNYIAISFSIYAIEKCQ